MVGFPACLKAEAVQISRFLIEVATDAAGFDAGRSQERGKARRKSSRLSVATRTTIRSRIIRISVGPRTDIGNLRIWFCPETLSIPIHRWGMGSRGCACLMQVSCLDTTSMLDRVKSCCDKGIGKEDIPAPIGGPASVTRNFRGAPNISGAWALAARPDGLARS